DPLWRETVRARQSAQGVLAGRGGRPSRDGRAARRYSGLDRENGSIRVSPQGLPHSVSRIEKRFELARARYFPDPTRVFLRLLVPCPLTAIIGDCGGKRGAVQRAKSGGFGLFIILRSRINHPMRSANGLSNLGRVARVLVKEIEGKIRIVEASIDHALE